MLNEYLLENLKEEGKRLGIPPNKNRALIREYLQSKIIYYLYEEKAAKNLSFIGGTSLRLLRDLDRFSEDLDFDNLELDFLTIKKLFLGIKNKLEKEGFEINYKMKKTNDSGIGEMKFENLLSQLKISVHEKENLIIKINYTTPKHKPNTEVFVLNRFGLVQSVVTNTREFLLSQKMRAALKRKDTQPRDFYDVVWFLSHKIEPDKDIFPEIGVKNKKELFSELESVYLERVKPNIGVFKKRLAPFLIDEKKVYYLDLFGDLLKEKR
jgi:predicted nucleotidyltransferase component of viral defense system